MIALVPLFSVLTLVAIAPWAIVAVSKCSGTFLDRLECVLDAHESTLIGLGTVVLVAGLALFTSYLTGRSADKREQSNRKIQAELQLAQFRQLWINELRDDLAKLSELLLRSGDGRDESLVIYLSSKIVMRLNLEKEKNSDQFKEPLAKSLFDRLMVAQGLYHDSTTSSGKKADAFIELNRLSNVFLRNEWGRLKEDLLKAQGLKNLDMKNEFGITRFNS